MNSEPAPRIFLGGLPQGDTSVIALIAEDEFASAQQAIPEWRIYATYEEWLDSREGYQMGLTFAGVDVRMTPIALGEFLMWCRDTKTTSSARALETFAGLGCDLSPKHSDSHPVAIAL
jgi:hypothetical protein